MNATVHDQFLQRLNAVQYDLLPRLDDELGGLTPKLKQVVYTLEWVRIEEFVAASWCGIGRPPYERAWLANAFVAKAILGLTTTVGLIERLSIDRALRRICGFSQCKKLPSEATFSRAFDEFAASTLPALVHEALIKENLGAQLIGHLSRDGTAIEARERPASATPVAVAAPAAQAELLPLQHSQVVAPVAVPAPVKKRGRPRRGEVREPAKESPIARQRKQTLAQMLVEIPTACDRGAKCNAKGYKTAWDGYKLHLDTADCGVPISVLLTSASVHDSRAAVPLSLMSDDRVTSLYDVMDAAYCSIELQAHSRSLGHVPLIDHNPRGGIKDEFEPADAIRYRERTAAERSNARLKDEFGGRHVMVRGAPKVMCHLMFGVLAMSADQLMRLVRIRRCPQ